MNNKSSTSYFILYLFSHLLGNPSQNKNCTRLLLLVVLKRNLNVISECQYKNMYNIFLKILIASQNRRKKSICFVNLYDEKVKWVTLTSKTRLFRSTGGCPYDKQEQYAKEKKSYMGGFT